jgi:predicted RNase H-like nuclease (RuvC/YqgF family)
MADYFREMFESLKQTAEALIQANEGIKRAVDAALAAKNEHEDLSETVHRLEALVLEQGREIRALRDDLRRG